MIVGLPSAGTPLTEEQIITAGLYITMQACSRTYTHTAMRTVTKRAHVSEVDGPGWGGAVAPPRGRWVVAAGDGGQLDGVRPGGCLRQQADLLTGALYPNLQTIR